MKNSNKKNCKNACFESWYLRIADNETAVAFVVGYTCRKDGGGECFIQTVSDNVSFSAEFPLCDFYNSKNNFYVKVCDNLFSNNGISLNLSHSGHFITANINFTNFPQCKASFPRIFLSSKREILSHCHNASGQINLDGKELDFNNAFCYIEKIEGKIFPTSHIFTQALADGFSMSTASAQIPVFSFCANIHSCKITVGKRKYRFNLLNSTFDASTTNELVFKSFRKRLIITVTSGEGMVLKFPKDGIMSGRAFHRVSTPVYIELFSGKKLIYSTYIKNGAFQRLSPLLSIKDVIRDDESVKYKKTQHE